MVYTVHGVLQARILEWAAMPFSRIFLTQELNLALLHCRQILYQLSHQGSPREPLIQLQMVVGGILLGLGYGS